MHKKTNEILEEHDGWLLVDVSTPSHPKASMKVDLYDWLMFGCVEDFGTICATRFKKSDSSLYAVFTEGHGRADRVTRRFHRFVAPELKCVDHENKDGLDNRRHNLRDGGGNINAFNQKIRKDNQTGFRGVKLRKDTGRYSASLRFNGVDYNLGCFDTAEEAGGAYKTFYNAKVAQNG